MAEVKSSIRRLMRASVFLALCGCATDQNVVYFDVPSHSLGRIISNAAAARTRTDILEVQRKLTEFQDEHLEYFPDRVSRLIKGCNYVLSHNLSGSQLVELSFRSGLSREPEAFEAGKLEPSTPIASGRKPDSRISPISTAAATQAAQPRPRTQPDVSLPGDRTPNAMEALSSHLVSKISDFEKRNTSGALKIAVHPFSVAEPGGGTGTRSTAFVLEAEIERALLGKDSIQVVTRRGLKDIQAEKRLSESEWNSGGEGHKKYGVEEADLIIRGQATIAANKRSMILNCELLNPSSGVLVASKSVTIEPKGGTVDYFLK